LVCFPVRGRVVKFWLVPRVQFKLSREMCMFSSIKKSFSFAWKTEVFHLILGEQ
jgi:hypothetical protein